MLPTHCVSTWPNSKASTAFLQTGSKVRRKGVCLHPPVRTTHNTAQRSMPVRSPAGRPLTAACCCAVLCVPLRRCCLASCLQVPACVVLSALAAYHAAVVDIEDQHIGVRNCCYPADIDGRPRGMIAAKSWPPQLQER